MWIITENHQIKISANKLMIDRMKITAMNSSYLMKLLRSTAMLNREHYKFVIYKFD
jgi:hypothetical protein